MPKEKQIDIAKALHPESNELQQDKHGNITAVIVDEELDAYECQFNYDGCVQVNTKGYDWITLSKENLHNLMLMIEEAEKRYDEMDMD
jgi:hypothetical protein